MAPSDYLVLFLIGVVVALGAALGILLVETRRRESRHNDLLEETRRLVEATEQSYKGQLNSLEEQVRRAEALPKAPPHPFDREIPRDAVLSKAITDKPFKLPEQLVTACVRRECVLFAGNGLSVMAGYPSWTEALTTLLVGTAMEPAERRVIEQALARGTTQALTEFLLLRRDRSALIVAIAELYGKAPNPAALEELTRIPFSSVLTTHWHNLLVQMFAERNSVVLRPRKGDLNKALQAGSFALVHLYGSLSDPDSILFTQSEYRRALEDDPLLTRFLTSLALTRTHFFLGASLTLLEDYFSNLALRDVPARAHFALVPEREGIEIDRDRLLRKYGLHLIVVPGARWDEVDRFIRQLREAVELGQTEEQPEIKASFLNHIRLTDIGPFRGRLL
jgi:hypothetical protein